MITFELLQKRKDGSLSSVTFFKAYSLEDAEQQTLKVMCTGERVLREVSRQTRLF